jgi:hypothetical protein
LARGSKTRRWRKGPFLSGLGVAVGLAAVMSSCAVPTPEPGEFGKYRFVNRAIGVPPTMPLFPPISDIAGNVYTVYGALNDKEYGTEISAFVSRNGGGELTLCDPENTPLRGDTYGAHSWVGYGQDKVWFWGGENLLEMTPFSQCRKVLDNDPGTNAALQFKAVLPWIYDAPSRTSVVAAVQSTADRLPFIVQVDLRASIFAKVEGFDPSSAEPDSVKFIGVGGDRVANVGSMLVQFRDNNQDVVEGRLYDRDANLISKAHINTPPLPEYGLIGTLQHSDAGLVAGLLPDNNVVLFNSDPNSGRIVKVENGMKPVGVHSWEGNLFLAGVAGEPERPVLAYIDKNGQFPNVVPWVASEKAAAVLAAGNLTVIDDRTLPSRNVVWPQTPSANSVFPFVTAHAPFKHSTGTTLWLIGGPQVDVNNRKQTAFAMSPVGISYP